MRGEVRYEGPRGCGHRKAGGKYLVSSGIALPCGRFPIPLSTCPTCGHGIRPARGWAWVKLPELLKDSTGCTNNTCGACPLSDAKAAAIDKCGLLWTGEKFYKSAAEFLAEAMRMGISRRISQIPRGLKVGETYVLLAHRKPEPHAFAIFRPERIEYVVREQDDDDKLDRLEAQGVTLVQVVPVAPQVQAHLPIAQA